MTIARRVNVQKQLLPVSSMWPIGPPVSIRTRSRTIVSFFAHYRKSPPPRNLIFTIRLLSPGGTLNVEVIGMLVGNCFGNPKQYPDFDFKLLKNTQIAIFRAVFRPVLGNVASIFQNFSRRL